jgi:hypothetical protein
MAKEKSKDKELILIETDVQDKIYLIRGCSVMLDSDLAELYEVETRVLNQAVSRNSDRFPEDFMFQLTADEWQSLTSQTVTSKQGRGGRRKAPNVFTEHGVLMLSSVLNSQRAIQVNIRIMRVFNQIRNTIIGATDIRLEISEIKNVLARQGKRQDDQDKNVELVFQYLEELNDKINHPPLSPDRERVGYKIGEKK